MDYGAGADWRVQGSMSEKSRRNQGVGGGQFSIVPPGVSMML